MNSYGYNPVGNLIAVGNKNQTYDAAGKVTVTGSAEITYDARNNRTALVDSVDANKNVEYVWTQNNLLKSVTTHDGATPNTVAYTYDADNLLNSRTEGASTDQFVWDNSRAIPAMLSDGKYEYVYSQDRTPIAQIEIATGIVIYLHHDLTGSVTASTDATGGLVGTVDYSPYGVATGALLSCFGYAGEWVDSVTNYSYLKARWLDTKTGTFLSEDPLVQMTNNAFSYTEGNPITQIDPLGLYSLITTGYYPMFIFSPKDLQFMLDRSGDISTLSAFASIIIPATAPVTIPVSLASGVIGANYEVSKCSGLWERIASTKLVDDRTCDPVNLTLSIAGAATGLSGYFFAAQSLNKISLGLAVVSSGWSNLPTLFKEPAKEPC